MAMRRCWPRRLWTRGVLPAPAIARPIGGRSVRRPPGPRRIRTARWRRVPRTSICIRSAIIGKRCCARNRRWPLGSTPPAEAPADWTEEEFGRAPFFDARLKQRLFTLAADFFAQPGELIPQASQGSAAKTKAAYRFFRNPQVDMPKLLRPHIESTLERIRSHPVILAVQDTTTLNYTAHPPQGVGPINNTQDRAVGLVLHDTMAFTPRGHAAGVAQRAMLGARSGAGGQEASPPPTADRREGKPQVAGELPGRGRGAEALSAYPAD